MLMKYTQYQVVASASLRALRAFSCTVSSYRSLDSYVFAPASECVGVGLRPRPPHPAGEAPGAGAANDTDHGPARLLFLLLLSGARPMLYTSFPRWGTALHLAHKTRLTVYGYCRKHRWHGMNPASRHRSRPGGLRRTRGGPCEGAQVPVARRCVHAVPAQRLGSA